jgi:hypothetical protein
MGKIRNYLLVVIFTLFLWDLGFSQTVILKSGQKVEGKVIEQSDKYVKLDFQGVELIFYNDEISSIEQTAPDGSSPLNPQMEALYKAYVSAVNSPKKLVKKPGEPVKKPAEEATPQASQEPASTDQPASTSQELSLLNLPLDLSQLPAEYREKIKEELAKLKTIKNSPEKASE